MNCNELSWGISRSYSKLQIYNRMRVLCTCWSILHLPDLARRQWRSWWRTVRIRTLALGGRTALRQLQRVFGNTASIGTIRCRDGPGWSSGLWWVRRCLSPWKLHSDPVFRVEIGWMIPLKIQLLTLCPVMGFHRGQNRWQSLGQLYVETENTRGL